MNDSPRHFGTGWISGTASVSLATLGLLTVLCFHFPSFFTIPDVRAYYPIPWIRGLLHLVLVAGFFLGLTSVVLRQNKWLGLIGMGIVAVAALLGGSRVQIDGELKDDFYLGLDYALLILMVYSIIFIPLEKLFGRLDQSVFRYGWRLDATYFFISTMLVQLTTYLTLKPAVVLFSWAQFPGVQEAIRSQPMWLQFLEIMLLADMVQYWVHRMFHQIPWLWKFHAVHHSAEVMDWMAGNRLHLVDLALTRSLIYIPSFVLGFDEYPMVAYIIFVSLHSVFIHSNLNFKFGWLRYVFATPQFHHWHHGAEPEAIDKNFAVHVPFLDYLFGTFFIPGERWPKDYGVHGEMVPKSFFAQFAYPFRKSKPSTATHQEQSAQ
jgi:sterol desaturase/sphingolipid hydroxylase (fatty acid hydroxylase superfamily)